jgi:Spy/CpxP family protein refolding chaperone
MKCPKCGKKISDKAIAKHLASKGGSKSRRVLTPEQAREMVATREAKRTTKGEQNGR